MDVALTLVFPLDQSLTLRVALGGRCRLKGRLACRQHSHLCRNAPSPLCLQPDKQNGRQSKKYNAGKDALFLTTRTPSFLKLNQTLFKRGSGRNHVGASGKIEWTSTHPCALSMCNKTCEAGTKHRISLSARFRKLEEKMTILHIMQTKYQGSLYLCVYCTLTCATRSAYSISPKTRASSSAFSSFRLPCLSPVSRRGASVGSRPRDPAARPSTPPFAALSRLGVSQLSCRILHNPENDIPRRAVLGKSCCLTAVPRKYLWSTNLSCHTSRTQMLMHSEELRTTAKGNTRTHLLVSLLRSLVLVFAIVSSRQQRRQARLVNLGK